MWLSTLLLVKWVSNRVSTKRLKTIVNNDFLEAKGLNSKLIKTFYTRLVDRKLEIIVDWYCLKLN